MVNDGRSGGACKLSIHNADPEQTEKRSTVLPLEELLQRRCCVRVYLVLERC